ncbi:hypothetical protein K474DRAFT_1678691 [Panus rudis PR-1116 ss-1]|nr:hypothetical protein K474DRAFT_1678691 [Panus rudis PR-1116 ss-1]
MGLVTVNALGRRNGEGGTICGTIDHWRLSRDFMNPRKLRGGHVNKGQLSQRPFDGVCGNVSWFYDVNLPNDSEASDKSRELRDSHQKYGVSIVVEGEIVEMAVFQAGRMWEEEHTSELRHNDTTQGVALRFGKSGGAERSQSELKQGHRWFLGGGSCGSMADSEVPRTCLDFLREAVAQHTPEDLCISFATWN